MDDQTIAANRPGIGLCRSRRWHWARAEARPRASRRRTGSSRRPRRRSRATAPRWSSRSGRRRSSPRPAGASACRGRPRRGSRAPKAPACRALSTLVQTAWSLPQSGLRAILPLLEVFHVQGSWRSPWMSKRHFQVWKSVWVPIRGADLHSGFLGLGSGRAQGRAAMCQVHVQAHRPLRRLPAGPDPAATSLEGEHGLVPALHCSAGICGVPLVSC
mmetsp:Transcript_26260/g.75354  ORF Transcript_26260/g.75354 Transcript_26260/m.75354 type:complete len:216 (+) Transcript_26260:611-1258(+)